MPKPRCYSVVFVKIFELLKAKPDADVLFWNYPVTPFHYLSFTVVTKRSTAVLLAQAPYQEPFRFLGEFIRRTLALMVAALNMCSPLLSDVSPSLEEQLIKCFSSYPLLKCPFVNILHVKTGAACFQTV